MAHRRSFLAILDPKPLVKASRLELGPLQTRGVPAILFGVAAVVLSSGASSALRRGATLLPETLREAREFWLTAREGRRELRSNGLGP